MMYFTRRDDRVWVNQFDPTFMVTGELLRCADERFLSRKFRTITIRCENGTQDYRMLAYDRNQDVFLCRAIPL